MKQTYQLKAGRILLQTHRSNIAPPPRAGSRILCVLGISVEACIKTIKTKICRKTHTLDVEIARQIRVHDHGRAELARIQEFDHCLRKRLETRPHCLHKEYAVLFGGGQKCTQLGNVGSNGLFAQNVFLGANGVESVDVVVSVGRSFKNIRSSSKGCYIQITDVNRVHILERWTEREKRNYIRDIRTLSAYTSS